MDREKLGSRLGFILVSAGCAIGLGNVWKFPYIAGKGGGGAFVLIYLIFLAILALPILLMEFAIGRASEKSPVKAYQELERPGSKWHWHGIASLAGCYLLMMFYTPVAGWMLYYFYLTSRGTFTSMTPPEVVKVFTGMLGEPWLMAGWMALVAVLAVIVCAAGLQKGVERVTKVLMIMLISVMIFLAIYAGTLPKAAEGLAFYLVPDFERMIQVGVTGTLAAAMSQAFFTLGLGIGSMLIFGSYFGRDHSLLGESINITLLDTFVAITSGLIIFPVCFSYGIDQTAGPGLILIALPMVFGSMPYGQLFGSAFFLFISFASMSTVIAVYENLIGCDMELMGWSRARASLFNLVAMPLLSMPCILGFNEWAWPWLKPLGGTILDLEDFFLSYILLPIGGLVYIFFCTSRYGWGWDNFRAEVNAGEGIKLAKWTRGYITFILPVIVLFVFLFGLYDKFLAG